MAQRTDTVKGAKQSSPGQGQTDGTRDGQSRQQREQREEVYEDVHQILAKTVDEIWEMFDDDGNGMFDFDETSAFIKHTLTEMGESPEYTEADFMQCFPHFGKGGKGYMTQPEMLIFIKKVAGLHTKDDEDKLKFMAASVEGTEEEGKEAEQES